jgi:putative hydrolase of the HAD superfamily
MRQTVLDMIAFDADDTLWQTESRYRAVEDRFERLLATYGVADANDLMHENEIRNLEHYGYGIKGFVLSLIETAIQATGSRIRPDDIQTIVNWAKEMQAAAPVLMEHAQATVSQLAQSYPLMLITKGEVFEQEAKIARCGLRQYFTHVEIVSDKTRQMYAAILARHDIRPERFLMVGNSLRSDILPVLELGARAVYIPAGITWAHETVELPGGGCGGCIQIEHLGQLPAVVAALH